MPIQYMTPLTPTPAVTTVDGPVTLSVDIMVTSGDVQQLDLDYIIMDPASAVFFQSGGKIERRQVPVTTAQMSLVNSTRLQCGPGVQDLLGAQIVLSISSNGVLQAPPIGCGVGISSYSCAPAVDPVMGGPVLSHALAPMAFSGAPGGVAGSTGGSGGKRGSRSGSTHKGKGAGTAKPGGKK